MKENFYRITFKSFNTVLRSTRMKKGFLGRLNGRSISFLDKENVKVFFLVSKDFS